jgi:myo-inositol-hexaphosphate 3-phosphohydrolase
MAVRTLFGAAALGVVTLTAGCVPPPAAPDTSGPATTAPTAATTTTSSTSTTTSTVPGPSGTVTVSPTVETPDRQPAGVNDADDAAIWVHPTDPSQSLIIATVKAGGLDVYRPDGIVV